MTKSRRFQSGAEIFDTYVPNYQREPSSLEQEANKMVKQILSEFDESLQKGLKKRRSKK